jgi:hypothetical protein
MSTEHLEPEQKDVLNIIKSNIGCNYDIIYNKGSLEKRDLSLVIHRLTQIGSIFKQNDCYFITSISDSDMATFNANKTKEAEAKLLVKNKNNKVYPWKESPEVIEKKNKLDAIERDVTTLAASVVKAQVKKIVDIAKEHKLPGNYNRGSAPGTIAMFFYLHRNEKVAFSVTNIIKELGVITKAGNKLSNVVYNLCHAGVIEVINPDEYKKFYKWSNLLTYPFSFVLDSDKYLIPGKIDTKENPALATVTTEQAEKQQLKQPVIPSKKPLDVPDTIHSEGLDEMLGIKAIGANKAAIELIDVRMKLLNSELNSLHALKTLLLNK